MALASLEEISAALEAVLPPTPSRVAVIGTRLLDEPGRERCAAVGSWLASRGHAVVSGASAGADLAFMGGASSGGGRVVAVLPWASYNAALIPPGCDRLVFDPARHPGWVMLAAAHHPAWDARRRDGSPVLSRGARALQARNTGILIGEEPQDRVALVVAHPSQRRTGGTEQGIRLAGALGIPQLLIGATESEEPPTLF